MKSRKGCTYRAYYRAGKSCAILSREDAAYIAGLIDGEGCVGAFWRKDANNGRGGPLVHVSFCMTDREVLDWLASVTGLGTVRGSYPYRDDSQRQRSHHRPAFAWRCTGDGATTLLEQVKPFLRISRKLEDAFHVVTLRERTRKLERLKPEDMKRPGEYSEIAIQKWQRNLLILRSESPPSC